jgi:FdhE protein
MPWPTPGLRTDLAARLADLEYRTPEWQAWLRLLGETLSALDDRAWAEPLAPAPAEPSGLPSAAPLLHGRTIVVNAKRLRRFVSRLAAATGAHRLRRYRPSPAGAVELIAAAVRQDEPRIEALAGAAGIDSAALKTVAHLAAVPLLESCGRSLGDQVPLAWSHGYCPICGAEPMLAERRGLDGTRRLRCGRCGGDWRTDWLRCVYCGERNHERLGSLVIDGGDQTVAVEICDSCHGYVKSFTTLQALPPFELLLRDLETLELDLVAMDRGYNRPERGGFALDLGVVARA